MRVGARIAKNFVSLASAGVARRALNFAISIYLARVLGASGFGLLAFAQAIIAYFSLVASLGLPVLGEREIARARDEIPRYVNSIIPLRLVLGAAAYLGLVLLVLFLVKGGFETTFLLLYGLVLFASTFNLEWVFRGTERMHFITLFELVSGALYVILIPLIVTGYTRLLHLALIILLSQIVGEFALIVIYRRRFGPIKPSFDPAFWKKLLKTSYPLGFSFLMGMLYFNVDIVMLSLIKGDATTGVYSAASRFMIIALLIPNLVVDAVFPVISRLYKRDKAQAIRLISLGTRFLYALGIPLAVGVGWLAEEIIELFYGSQYYLSALPLRILAAAVALMFVSGMSKQSLIAMNLERKYLMLMVTATLINVGANAVLIPFWGPEGAAIATVAAEIFAVVYCMVQLRGIMDWRVVGVLVASVVMGAVVWVTKSRGLKIAVPAGVLVYFATVFLFRGMRFTDIRYLKQQVFGSQSREGITE